MSNFLLNLEPLWQCTKKISYDVSTILGTIRLIPPPKKVIPNYLIPIQRNDHWGSSFIVPIHAGQQLRQRTDFRLLECNLTEPPRKMVMNEHEYTFEFIVDKIKGMTAKEVEKYAKEVEAETDDSTLYDFIVGTYELRNKHNSEDELLKFLEDEEENTFFKLH